MRTFHVTLRYDLPDEMIERFGGDEYTALAHAMEHCDDDGVVNMDEILPNGEVEGDELSHGASRLGTAPSDFETPLTPRVRSSQRCH